MEFTLDNHLQYTIGDRLFGVRQTPYERFVVKVGQPDSAIMKRSSWREELRRTANHVYEQMYDPVVFLSGGTDSEIVVRNFLEVGVHPVCVTIRLSGGYNAEDVQEATRITNELGLKQHIVDFDVKNFYYSGEAAELAQAIDCSQITYLMVYHHVRKLQMPAVMGGEMLLRRHTEGESFWYHCFRENEDASAMRFTHKFDIPLVNEWFSYTPEMVRFFLDDPDVQKLIRGRNFKLTSVSSKNQILNRLYPGLRMRKKTHGFERLLAFNSESYANLQNLLIPRLEPSLDGVRI